MNGHAGDSDHPQVLAAMKNACECIASANRVAGALTTPTLLDHISSSG